MRYFVFAAIGLILLGICGYLYWMSTPMYALQEAGLAAARHDLPTFEKVFDIDRFVENLLDDTIVKPAKTTPGLSALQQETGRELIQTVKTVLSKQLTDKIRNTISGGSSHQEGKYQSLNFNNNPNSSAFAKYGPDAAFAGNSSVASDVQSYLRAAGSELGHEAHKLQRESYLRMKECARQQPKTLTGKLLGSPPQTLGFQAKLLIDEYGFTKDNFRGLTGFTTQTESNSATRAVAGLKFYSPRAGKEVVMQLGLFEMTMFGGWKIDRIENVPELLLSLNEDNEYQMHALMTCALSGVTEQSVHDEVKGLTDRIKQHIDTKDLLNNLKMRFK